MRADGPGQDGGVPDPDARAARRRRRYDVMVCTPLRLVLLLRKGALTLASLEDLVLDEADKLLELGFLEQCDEVLAACDGATVQRCLFSATMPPAVVDLMHSVLPGPGGCGREERGGGHGGAVAPSSAGARTASSSRCARWCARGCGRRCSSSCSRSSG